MVQVFHVSGIASARTTAISLGAFIGRGRIATLTALSLIARRSNALAAHSHGSFTVRASNVAFASVRGLAFSAGSLLTSTAHGAYPVTANVVNAAVPGVTTTAYTVDSNGRYVLAATHPATLHAVLKPHGSAGPRIEIGDAVRAGDIIQISAMTLTEMGGSINI